MMKVNDPTGFNSAYTMDALEDYIRFSGFLVQNPALIGTGHDGSTRGAVQPPVTATDTGTAIPSTTKADIVTGNKTIITTIANATVAVATALRAIGYVGSQVGQFAGTTTAQTVTFALTGGLSSTPQAGDLVIITYGVGSTADRTLIIETTGAVAYTLAGSEMYQNDTFDANQRTAYRFMPGTPDTQFRLSETAGGTGNAADAGAYTVHVFRNVDASTPLDVAAVTAGNINGRVVDPGQVTPTTAGAMIYVAGVGAGGTGGTYTAAYLSGFRATTQVDTNDVMIGAGYVPWTTGAYNPAAFSGGGTTTTNDAWTAITLALRPASYSPFNDARQAYINGFVSQQSEPNGWNAKRALIPVTAVVRTNDNTITFTIPAIASYDVTATETIPHTIPAAMLSSGEDVLASPTWTITAGAAGYTLVADVGTYTLTGQSARLLRGRTVTGAVGTYALTGQAARLLAGKKVTAALGTYSVSGQAAALRATRRVIAAQGSYALNGQPVTLRASRSVLAALGSYSLNGQPVTLSLVRKVAAALGSFVLTGQSVGLIRGRIVRADVGSFSLNGQPVSLRHGSRLIAALGSYALNGQDVSFTQAKIMSAALGSYSLTGQDVDLFGPAKFVAADVGSFVLSGQAVRLLRGTRLISALGSYALTGQAARLLRGRTAKADVGIFTLSGQAATLRYSRRMPAGVGLFSLSGQNVVLGQQRALFADVGSYSLSGQAALFHIEHYMHADLGSYTLSGQAAALRAQRRVTAGLGAYTMTGQAARLLRGRTVIAAGGLFTLQGFDANFSVVRRLLAGTGFYSLMGQSAVVFILPRGSFGISVDSFEIYPSIELELEIEPTIGTDDLTFEVLP
jgi:hypothetical protein